MQKPRFFLSSTVFDFKDLRSALKYYLEQHGCLVSASEHPDFRIAADKHSYESCLENIKSSDYFILLIGARVGGWYDKENKISITQQEYRTAYDLHRKGKIKILSFVRSEIWEHRENRSELKRYLQTIEIDPLMRSSIENHSSKICDDSEFIINFINEVSRNSETKKALTGEIKTLPTGNWIYTFRNFRDIIDSIQSQVMSELPLEQSATKHLLYLESRENLKTTLVRIKEKVFSPEFLIENFYANHKITSDNRNSEFIIVNGKNWSSLSSIAIQLLGMKIQTRILEHCLRTSLFVEHDPISGKVIATKIQKDLISLAGEIEKFHRANNSETLKVIFKYSPKNGYSRERPVSIAFMELLPLMHLYDRWINIIKLSTALANYLSGQKYVSPNLRPRSPIPDMNQELDAQDLTEEQIDTFLAENIT